MDTNTAQSLPSSEPTDPNNPSPLVSQGQLPTMPLAHSIELPPAAMPLIQPAPVSTPPRIPLIPVLPQIPPVPVAAPPDSQVPIVTSPPVLPEIPGAPVLEPVVATTPIAEFVPPVVAVPPPVPISAQPPVSFPPPVPAPATQFPPLPPVEQSATVAQLEQTSPPESVIPNPVVPPVAAPVPAPADQSAPESPQPAVVAESGGTSTGTKNLITILLLIFAFPIGAVMMFAWTNWKMWVKLLIVLPTALILIALVVIGIMGSINPGQAVEKASCMKQCQTTQSVESCTIICANAGVITPSPVATFEPSFSSNVGP